MAPTLETAATMIAALSFIGHPVGAEFDYPVPHPVYDLRTMIEADASTTPFAFAAGFDYVVGSSLRDIAQEFSATSRGFTAAEAQSHRAFVDSFFD